MSIDSVAHRRSSRGVEIGGGAIYGAAAAPTGRERLAREAEYHRGIRRTIARKLL